MRKVLLPLVALTLLAACGGDDAPATATISATSVTRAPTTTAPPRASASSAAAPTTGAAGTTAATTTTAAPTTAAPATTAAGRVIAVTVVGGVPQGGARTERIAVGERVVIRVTADVADELHVHGYDLSADLAAGVPAEITLTADIPGVFAVELEQRGVPVLELQVR